MYQKVLKCLTN